MVTEAVFINTALIVKVFTAATISAKEKNLKPSIGKPRLPHYLSSSSSCNWSGSWDWWDMLSHAHYWHNIYWRIITYVTASCLWCWQICPAGPLWPTSSINFLVSLLYPTRSLCSLNVLFYCYVLQKPWTYEGHAAVRNATPVCYSETSTFSNSQGWK